jgi:hypothetical protein
MDAADRSYIPNKREKIIIYSCHKSESHEFRLRCLLLNHSADNGFQESVNSTKMYILQ